MENLIAAGVSLLDILRVYASCAYVSDLRELSGPQRMNLARKLGKLLPESISLWQWNDALLYLVGNPPAESALAARTRLLSWLSRPLEPDVDLFDEMEPVSAAV
jgi:hypothetical protein